MDIQVALLHVYLEAFKCVLVSGIVELGCQLDWSWNQWKDQQTTTLLLWGSFLVSLLEVERPPVNVVTAQAKEDVRRKHSPACFRSCSQVHLLCHCCYYISLLISWPNFIRLLTWTEDRQLFRNPPDLQGYMGTSETSGFVDQSATGMRQLSLNCSDHILSASVRNPIFLLSACSSKEPCLLHWILWLF